MIPFRLWSLIQSQQEMEHEQKGDVSSLYALYRCIWSDGILRPSL
jgi:hypothetical protein